MSKIKKLIVGICIISIALSVAALIVAYCFNQTLDSKETINSENETIVIIDAGHGGQDGGAVATDGTLEKDLNFQVAEKLKNLLNSQGILAVMTRESDEMLSIENSKGTKKMQDLKARADLTEKYENCIFVSLHMNKYSSEKYSGLQVFYSDNNELNESLAASVQANIKNILQPENNREIKKSGSNIYLLEKISKPSVLIECGFLSNNEERENLKSDEYQQKLASVICVSIVEFLNNL